MDQLNSRDKLYVHLDNYWIIPSHKYLANGQVYDPYFNPFSPTLCLSFFLSLPAFACVPLFSVEYKRCVIHEILSLNKCIFLKVVLICMGSPYENLSVVPFLDRLLAYW
jgi:hypothetical protein